MRINEASISMLCSSYQLYWHRKYVNKKVNNPWVYECTVLIGYSESLTMEVNGANSEILKG